MKKYQPILFNQDMLKAIVDGKKTQTRRPLKFKQYVQLCKIHGEDLEKQLEGKEATTIDTSNIHEDYTFNGAFSKGDILYIRETFREWPKGVYRYKLSTPAGAELEKWKPSIHMPKEAARYFLKVTNVKIERLGDISEVDALKEGMHIYGPFLNTMTSEQREEFKKNTPPPIYYTAKDAFLTETYDIFKKSKYVSKSGLSHKYMYVWVYEFELVDKPQDF